MRLVSTCVRQHLSRCAMLRKKHIHTLNETLKEGLMNIERKKVHELVEALERTSLKCLYTKCQHLARGQKGSEHLNLNLNLNQHLKG